MSKKIRKCDYYGHNEMVNEQHDFMLGMDTAQLVCGSNSEIEYNMFKRELIRVTDYMFKSLEKNCKFYDCENCKYRYRSINSKKYFDKMLEIVNNDAMDMEDKLSDVYDIEEQYFNEFGSF